MKESEAIELLKKKRPQGLTWLVERYQLKALRAAYLVTRDTALAEDVVQSKFIDLYRNMRTYDSTRPFAPWFMRSVVNTAITAATTASRPVVSGTLEEFEHLVDTAETPESQAVQKEAEQVVQKALDQLSPKSRAVVVMRYYLEVNDPIPEAGACP